MDSPEHYGVACKRVNARDSNTKSEFNSKKTAPEAIRQLILKGHDKSRTLLVSYNDESWVTKDEMLGFFEDAGFRRREVLTFDYDRYVGARIGIYNPRGEKTGNVSHTRNHEYVFIGSDNETMRMIRDAVSSKE